MTNAMLVSPVTKLVPNWVYQWCSPPRLIVVECALFELDEAVGCTFGCQLPARFRLPSWISLVAAVKLRWNVTSFRKISLVTVSEVFKLLDSAGSIVLRFVASLTSMQPSLPSACTMSSRRSVRESTSPLSLRALISEMSIYLLRLRWLRLQTAFGDDQCWK